MSHDIEVPITTIDDCNIGTHLANGSATYLSFSGQESDSWGTLWEPGLGVKVKLEQAPENRLWISFLHATEYIQYFLSLRENVHTFPQEGKWSPRNQFTAAFSPNPQRWSVSMRYPAPSDSGNLIRNSSTNRLNWVRLSGSQLFVSPTWDYSNFPQARQALLGNKFDPTVAIVETLKTANVLGFRRTEAARMPGFFRAEITVTVGTDTFDILFNSPAGVRGQFFLDPLLPGNGDSFSRKLINELLDPIERKFPDDINFIRSSLQRKSAKVWMDENEGLPDPNDQAFDVPQWTGANPWDENLQKLLGLDMEQIADLQEWGTRAPVRNNIALKGAFINKNHDVWVPPEKQTRPLQIAYLGFT